MDTAPPVEHFHGENVSHSHFRGLLPHSHLTKRQEDNPTLWMWFTKWEDGNSIYELSNRPNPEPFAE